MLFGEEQMSKYASVGLLPMRLCRFLNGDLDISVLLLLLFYYYLCRRLASGEGIVICDARRLCVCLSVRLAATAWRTSLAGEGNALYSELSN